jgi:hypothetical protein
MGRVASITCSLYRFNTLAYPASMAPEAPDPQSLKSWHDAFQYPIPTVRRVEQELRRDISSNKEKLRALVG